MPGPRNLEKNLLLALEHDLAIVDAPRGEHDAVSIDELLPSQALVSLGRSLQVAFAQLGIDFGRGHRLQFTPPVWHCKSALNSQLSAISRIVNQFSAVSFQRKLRLFAGRAVNQLALHLLTTNG